VIEDGVAERARRPAKLPPVPWRARAARGRAAHFWPALTGLLLGLLALGPALSSGFVLSYDMVFVPDPPVGYANLGFGGGPPRNVPSDLVVALAAKIIPAGLVEKLILISIFVLACSGAAALLSSRRQLAGGERPPLLAQLVAGVCYAWNPFVAERLIMGQWAMLLGYAGLPWVLREVRGREAGISPARLAVAILPAAIGGFAAMSITVVGAIPVALCGGSSWAERGRRLTVTLAVIAIASLPWVIPSLVNPVHANASGVGAFAARADTPFGAFGSLLLLGGIWNAQAVPAGYGGPAAAFWLALMALAAIGYVGAVRRSRASPDGVRPEGVRPEGVRPEGVRPEGICPGAGVAAIAGLCIAAVGLTGPTRTALRAAISFWPGFALLRDGQQFVAPLAVAAALGLGAGVAALIVASREPGRSRLIRGTEAATGPVITLGVLALVAPLALLPGLAWGAAGRLQAVQYPADWLIARRIIQADGHGGSVLLLPWAEYRRYPWNHGEAVYDPWPRFVARPMIWNDALQIGRMTVPAESQRARELTRLINSGKPLTAGLTKAGVRYVVVDSGPLLRRDRQRRADLAALARLPGASVALAGPDLVLFRLPGDSQLPASWRKLLFHIGLAARLAHSLCLWAKPPGTAAVGQGGPGDSTRTAGDLRRGRCRAGLRRGVHRHERAGEFQCEPGEPATLQLRHQVSALRADRIGTAVPEATAAAARGLIIFPRRVPPRRWRRVPSRPQDRPC
jgi:hypothetical protein